MNQESPDVCPECGKAVPAGSPHQLCPACLMAQALASRTIAGEGGKPGAVPPPAPEEIADRFPQFEITECLGRGGMGVVYKARQKSLDRWVAIKILAPERVGQEKFAERFAREAQTLARLNHPNIVGVFDYGETGGLYYFVMEFVDGVNLRDLLREGRLEAKQALAIVPPICDALQYAHEKGIVHRDIKPENLLLDREGRVKIADFGIAALVGTEGEPAGTPPYMAPEQTARREVDHRADIYALGVVLYEMLTGERPGKEAMAPSRKVQIDVRLDEIVLRALEKNPERRYEQASIFKTQVETLSPSPDAATSSPASASSEKVRREQMVICGAAILCTIGFIVMLVLALDYPRQSAGPWILVGLNILGLIVCGVRLAGFWPFPSLFFPRPNFSSRNLERTSGGGQNARPTSATLDREERISGAGVSLITAILCLIALLMGLFLDSPHSGLVIVIGVTGFIAALSNLKRRGAWPFCSEAENKSVREVSSASPAESFVPFLARCALVLFLAALILPPILAAFARSESLVLLVGAVCGIASFALGLLTWKLLPGRIAAIGVPIVALVLTSLVLVRKEQARRLAALAGQHARDAALQAKAAHEPPKLQYLAWQDEVQTNPRWQAWTPTGELVRHEDFHMPTNLVIPSETDISGTKVAAEKPRFLCLWFSQPAFDAQSVGKITLLNEANQPLETPTHDFATGISPASPESWNLGWITASLCAGRMGQTPPKVTVRLEYSAGAWQFWDELPVNFHGSMALSNGVLVTDPAQGADGKAFVQVTRDHAQDPGNEQFDFVAVMKGGRRLNRVGLSQGATGNVVTERTIFDAPLDQIAKFECRKRPIQTATWDVPLLREPAFSAFGPVVECTMGNESVIDFEAGKVIAELPFAVTNEDDIAKALLSALTWMRHEGLDAMYDIGGWFSTKGLKCVDMKTAPLENDAWDRLAPEQLASALADAKAETWGSLDGTGKFPKTYAFQTREGVVGILQLIGTTEEPQSVKLRYKLVQPTPRE
jgi:serine/threonine protein kinase